MRVALKTIFTKKEQFLLRNNQAFMINSDESDNSDSSSMSNYEALSDEEKTQAKSAYFDKLLAGAVQRRKKHEKDHNLVASKNIQDNDTEKSSDSENKK